VEEHVAAPDAARRSTGRLFRLALGIKAVDGAGELIAALALLLVPGAVVHAVVNAIISRDLLGPPDGSLARHFVAGTGGFESGNRAFAVIYLGLHGMVKLALVVALQRSWRPAYPTALVVLGAFVIYELYRATQTGSLLLPFLAGLDVAVIVLIFREYRLLR
jgi:uncharacterized membrane protein